MALAVFFCGAVALLWQRWQEHTTCCWCVVPWKNIMICCKECSLLGWLSQEVGGKSSLHLSLLSCAGTMTYKAPLRFWHTLMTFHIISHLSLKRPWLPLLLVLQPAADSSSWITYLVGLIILCCNEIAFIDRYHMLHCSCMFIYKGWKEERWLRNYLRPKPSRRLWIWNMERQNLRMQLYTSILLWRLVSIMCFGKSFWYYVVFHFVLPFAHAILTEWIFKM